MNFLIEKTANPYEQATAINFVLEINRKDMQRVYVRMLAIYDDASLAEISEGAKEFDFEMLFQNILANSGNLNIMIRDKDTSYILDEELTEVINHNMAEVAKSIYALAQLHTGNMITEHDFVYDFTINIVEDDILINQSDIDSQPVLGARRGIMRELMAIKETANCLVASTFPLYELHDTHNSSSTLH